MATGLSEWVINSQYQHAHTYTVETDTKSFLLECGHKPVFGSMGEECGGRKKLQLEDVIHFRIEKNWVYIPITKSDNSASEEKLRVMSAALKAYSPGQQTPGRAREDRNEATGVKVSAPSAFQLRTLPGKPDTRQI